MSASDARDLIAQYYAAFNAKDWDGMLACLSEDIRHDVNEGDRRGGRQAFRTFLEHMARCYGEQLTDIAIMTDADGARAAAEFVVNGTYLETDGDLPPARGQRYRLPAGAFLEIRNGQIARVTTYYNLKNWLAQVS